MIHGDRGKRLRTGYGIPCNAGTLHLAPRFFLHLSWASFHHQIAWAPSARAYLPVPLRGRVWKQDNEGLITGWKTGLRIISIGAHKHGGYCRCYANSNKQLLSVCCVHCTLLGAQGLFLTVFYLILKYFLFFKFPFWEIFYQLRPLIAIMRTYKASVFNALWLILTASVSDSCNFLRGWRKSIEHLLLTEVKTVLFFSHISVLFGFSGQWKCPEFPG